MAALDDTDHAAISDLVGTVGIEAYGRTFPTGANVDIHHDRLVAICSKFLIGLQGKPRICRCCDQGNMP